MEHLPKDYIGDGVYIKDIGYGVRLTTEDGISVQNEIVMEPEVISAFNRYIERMKQHYATQTTDS